MDQVTILLLFLVGVWGFWHWQKGHDDGYLIQVVDALRRSSGVVKLSWADTGGEELLRIASSIDEGMSLLLSKRRVSEAEIAQMVRDVFKASSGEVLDTIGIYETNQRANCYRALMRLGGRLRKLNV